MSVDQKITRVVDGSPAALLDAALGGDESAFAALIEPRRTEILAHCYRMLGSLQEAEEIVQETFLRAWRRLDTYAGQAPFRAWLYRISTNACLDALARRPKRALPQAMCAPTDPHAPLPQPVMEPIWIEPFPDELAAPLDAGPEARYELRESISVAFLVALQLLSPRQRCALLLSEVLDWGLDEIAAVLETTLSAANSLVYRARKILRRHYQTRMEVEATGEHVQRLLARYLQAWETADIEGIVSLLTEDVSLPMPPLPVWYQGREVVRTFLAASILAGGYAAKGRWRLLPTRANGRPAFAFYLYDPEQAVYHAFALQILELRGEKIADLATFGFPGLFPYFGLPGEISA